MNAGDNESIEEVGSANLFIVKDKTVLTPPLGGTILPGVTRDSVIHISREILGLDVEERPISLSEMMEADEVFCTGTAVSVTPIGEITSDDSVSTINGNKIGNITLTLNTELTDIQKEIKDDPFGWLIQV